MASPAGTQAHATATCPSPDVLPGGGALPAAGEAAAVLASAWPSTSAKFTGYLDNGTAFASNLIADAVCGHKPAGYKIVSDSFTLGPQSLLLDGLTCPSGTPALDGGTQVPGHAPAVQISGSIGEGHLGWAAAVNNTGLATEQEHSYVICAAQGRAIRAPSGSAGCRRPGSSLATSPRTPWPGAGRGRTAAKRPSSQAMPPAAPPGPAWPPCEPTPGTCPTGYDPLRLAGSGRAARSALPGLGRAVSGLDGGGIMGWGVRLRGSGGFR